MHCSSRIAPMRTPWQGAEGIAWLAVCPRDELEPGGFYLDRRPQAKHMAGGSQAHLDGLKKDLSKTSLSNVYPIIEEESEPLKLGPLGEWWEED